MSIEQGAGVVIGLRNVERKQRILAYRVLSNPNRKEYSKRLVLFVGIINILVFILPCLCLGFIPKLFTLDDIGGKLGVGTIIGCFVSFIMLYPTIANIVAKHITMPYFLKNKETFRWGLGVVYQDEIDKYVAWRGNNDVYILVNRMTGEIINKDVHPPIQSLGTRIIWILITIGITAFFSVAMIITKEEDAWIAVACFIPSLVALVLVIFRTIKPEY